MKSIVMSVFVVVCCIPYLQAQQTFSSAGGVSQLANINISWTVGQPIQTYGVSTEGIYTIGYQQPNIIAPIPTSNLLPIDGVKVYPNPTVNELNIELPESMLGAPLNIQLFTANGQPLQSKVEAASFNKSIDLSNYPSGHYLLRLESAGKTNTYPIIKTKE